MKQIVVISNMFPSKDHPTFGIFVKNQVDLLGKSGRNIAVIANKNPDKGKVNLAKKYLGWFSRFMAYMSRNHKEVTAIHAHYIFPTGLLALAAKKVWKTPYVVTAHGGDLDQMPNKSGIVRKLTAAILKNADEVIVVGEALKENALKLYPLPDKQLHVISMGVDTGVFCKLPPSAYEGLVPPGKNPVFLYVGNIIRAKGLIELLDSFKKVLSIYPDASLYMIGSRKDKVFADELLNKIRLENLPSIHFKDPMPQKEIAKWMNAADVLVLPSHIEGFGLVALEAMATGLPVVGSRVGGLEYLLADGRGLLFDRGDSEMLAEAMLTALNDSDGRLDQEKIQAVVEENSNEAILAQLLRIYEGMNPSNE